MHVLAEYVNIRPMTSCLDSLALFQAPSGPFLFESAYLLLLLHPILSLLN